MAITREMDDDELEAVIAHEMAHIRHKDVGLLTVVSILTGLCKGLANQLRLVRTPAATLLSLVLNILNRLIFPVGVSTIQCEREYSADALGAFYMGKTEPLKTALQKLSAALEPLREKQQSPLQEMIKPLTPSHPGMEKRFDALDSYKINS